MELQEVHGDVSEVVDLLERSSTSTVPIVDDHFTPLARDQEHAESIVKFSRKLHYMLAQLCAGSARLLVRQNVGNNGFETWRRLHEKFSLPDATRHVSLLTRLLGWNFKTEPFEQDFNAWKQSKPSTSNRPGKRFPTQSLWQLS